jgi:hypothetical protein
MNALINGFKSKNQDEQYSKSLYGLVFLMQYTIAKLISNPSLAVEQCFNESKFMENFTPLYSKLSSIEKWKKVPPKYTFAFQNLKSKLNKSTMTQTNSRFSTTSLGRPPKTSSKERLIEPRRESIKYLSSNP